MGYMRTNTHFNLTENRNNELECKLSLKQQYLLNCFASVDCGKVYNLYDVLKDYCKKALQNMFKPSDLINGQDLHKVAQYMSWDGYLYTWDKEELDGEPCTVANSVRDYQVTEKDVIKLSIRTTAKGNYTFMVIDNTDDSDIVKAFEPKTKFHVSKSPITAGEFEEFLED